MERVRGGFGRRSGEGGAAATQRDVESGEVGGDSSGPGGGDDGRLRLLQKPLNRLPVGLVTQLSRQLEDPSGAGGRHADAAASAIHLRVAVLGGALGGDGELPVGGSCRNGEASVEGGGRWPTT